MAGCFHIKTYEEQLLMADFIRKIKLLPAVLVCTAVVLMLGGCGGYTINLVKDEFTVNVGDELDMNISSYVRASKAMLADMTIDLSQVDTDKMGTYNASVTYGEDVREFKVKVTDIKAPEISLKSEEIYFEQQGTLQLDNVVASVKDYSDYEYGFSKDMTLADKDKEMVDTLSFDSLGDYNAEVIAKDSFGNISVRDFRVHVVEPGKIPGGAAGIPDYSAYMNTSAGVDIGDLDSYDTTGVYYGLGDNVDSENNRPQIGYYTNLYDKYRVDFIEPQSSYIWLTFNEIGENGRTVKILDTLKEKGVKAVFFVTLSYVKDNEALVRRMIDEGHVIGNYTASGKEVGDLSLNQLTSELDTLYNYVYETFGYEMYLFRPPSGYFNEQTIAAAQKSGYRTVFWSYAYADWDSQMTTRQALSKALARAHGGAIYSLSASSSLNQKMLADLIDGIRAKGFEFAFYQKN